MFLMTSKTTNETMVSRLFGAGRFVPVGERLFNRYRASFLAAAVTSGLLLTCATRVLAQYDSSVGSTYSGQQTAYFCGPATAQMILGSTTVNLTPLPDQPTIFTNIINAQGGNYYGAPPRPGGKIYSNDGNYLTNPSGLRSVLATADPSRTYIAYNQANVNIANRTLAYNVDHYRVPGGALLYQGGHWVAVVGVDTSVQPAITGPNTNFTVNGFYVRDPWTGFKAGQGLGRNAYLATAGADAKWTANFTPTKYGGSWQGNYAFVTDPDASLDIENSLASAPPPVNGGVTAPMAVSLALSDINQVSGLANDLSFENGAFSQTGEADDPVLNADNEWLVPYYQTGDADPSGIAAIDASTGALDGAYWDEGVLDADSLSSFDSVMAAEDMDTPTAYDGDNPMTDNVDVPEPSTIMLLGLGGLTLLPCLRRRKLQRSKSVKSGVIG